MPKWKTVAKQAASLAAAVIICGSFHATATSLTGPVTWGSPDQPFGVRRAVTAADRALIASYRAKKPIYSTAFAKADELQADWKPIVDDQPGLKSCRRPGNVETSNVGARFQTRVATDCRARWATGSIATKAQYGYGFSRRR